jgi:hypothetical protein
MALTEVVDSIFEAEIDRYLEMLDRQTGQMDPYKAERQLKAVRRLAKDMKKHIIGRLLVESSEASSDPLGEDGLEPTFGITQLAPSTQQAYGECESKRRCRELEQKLQEKLQEEHQLREELRRDLEGHIHKRVLAAEEQGRQLQEEIIGKGPDADMREGVTSAAFSAEQREILQTFTMKGQSIAEKLESTRELLSKLNAGFSNLDGVEEQRRRGIGHLEQQLSGKVGMESTDEFTVEDSLLKERIVQSAQTCKHLRHCATGGS